MNTKHAKLATHVLLASIFILTRCAWADDFYVDPVSGSDTATGTRSNPFRTVSAALARVPEVVATSFAIHLAPGTAPSTGAHGVPSGTLVLDRRTRRTSDSVVDVSVHFCGEGPGFGVPAEPGQVVLDWGSTPLVEVKAGVWYFENVQLANRSCSGSQQGLTVYGSESLVHLKAVRIRTGCHSGPGILASRSAEVRLYGAIELNEDLHDLAVAGSFCGIIAEYHAAVRFADARVPEPGQRVVECQVYGTIELGGAWARITSWGDQSNCLAVNNSGRIDLHSTRSPCAPKNPATP